MLAVDEGGWLSVAGLVAAIVVCVLCVVNGLRLRREDSRIRNLPAGRSLRDNPDWVGSVWIIGGSLGTLACLLGLTFALVQLAGSV